MFLSLVLSQVTSCCSKVAAYFTRILHVQVQVLVVQSQTAFPRGFVLAVFDSAIVHYPAVSNNLVVLHIWQEWGLEVTNVTTELVFVSMELKMIFFLPAQNRNITNWTSVFYSLMLSSHVFSQFLFFVWCKTTTFEFTFENWGLLGVFMVGVYRESVFCLHFKTTFTTDMLLVRVLCFLVNYQIT